MAGQARERLTDATSHAREMMHDRMSHMREMDWSSMSDSMMNYTRQNPGQAILISAGVGFMLGLLLRPSR